MMFRFGAFNISSHIDIYRQINVVGFKLLRRAMFKDIKVKSKKPYDLVLGNKRTLKVS